MKNEMKNERPILFSGEMVRAIQEGRKTQTRRVVNPQPPLGCSYSINGGQNHALCFQTEHGTQTAKAVWVLPTAKSIDHRLRCPYGQPGDRLWVKETHWRFGRWVKDGKTKTGRARWRFRIHRLHKGAAFEPPLKLRKRTSEGWHKRPAIFMPRAASRISLEITVVRVERVQDISEKDAEAEGVEFLRDIPDADETLSAKTLFEIYWDFLAKRGHGWRTNPWVWVIEFRRKGIWN